VRQSAVVRDRGGDCVMQRLHAEGNILRHPVDEECRGRANVAQASARHVLANLLKVDVVVHFRHVTRHVRKKECKKNQTKKNWKKFRI